MPAERKYTAFRYELLTGEQIEKHYPNRHTDNEMYNYFKHWCKRNDNLLEVVWLEYFNAESGTWC